ncbi:tetratricopeptide repeat protein [Pseudonocardia nematodicida]|uniref:Tetratricopeptide repeat protein n=1 Tax=Pseudonocardia nematodicida TaxID=1206997 RepID=A0ABV1KHB6_9PSEU
MSTGESVATGSAFPRPGPAAAQPGDGARAVLRERHDRAAAAVRDAAHTDPAGAPAGAALREATRRLEQVLTAARRDLGPRDTDTLVVEGSLAVAYLLGDAETRGLELAGHNLAAREYVLGPDHPASLAAADALAAAFRLVGRPDEAVRRHDDVVTRRRRVLGDAHPDTLAARAALALAQADTGDLHGAANRLVAAAGTAERALGPEHPLTARLRDLLDELREAVAAEPAPLPTGRPHPGPAPAAGADDRTALIPPVVPAPPEETRLLFLDRPSGPLPVIR